MIRSFPAGTHHVDQRVSCSPMMLRVRLVPVLAQAPSVCRDHRTRHTPRERHDKVAAPVGKHHDDDSLRREQTEDSCYAGHAAGVAYLAKAASVIVDPPSEAISCAGVDLRVNALHLTDALWLQNAWRAVRRVARALIQVKHPEPDEIVRTRVHRRCAAMIDVVEAERRVVDAVPNSRARRWGGWHGSLAELERFEQLAMHELSVRDAGDPLDDVIEDAIAEI